MGVRGGALTITVVFCVIQAYASSQTGKWNATTHKAPIGHKRRTEMRSKGIHERYHALRGRLARARHLVYHRRRYARTRESRSYPHYLSTASHISPERTDQIQEALIQAGDLQGEPTGRWDAETREAMKKYQEANRFTPTGLPDAKSLMKMGLGPHPLPADLDPTAQTSGDSGSPSADAGTSEQ